MNTVTRRQRPGRPRSGERSLTRGEILGAALRIVDNHGVGALTMRRLAGELGVNPMSIYHHLPGKAAVLSGLVEVVDPTCAVVVGTEETDFVAGLARALPRATRLARGTARARAEEVGSIDRMIGDYVATYRLPQST